MAGSQAWLAGPQAWLAGPQAWLAGTQVWLDGPEGGTDKWMSKRTNKQKISPFYKTLSPTQATALLPPMKTKKNLSAMAKKSGLIQAPKIKENKNK